MELIGELCSTSDRMMELCTGKAEQIVSRKSMTVRLLARLIIHSTASDL
jgi:hypothetical protein